MAEKKRLLMATVVWGDWHLSKLTDLNLPTLLAPRNLPALAVACDITYLLYTSEKDLLRVRSAPAIQSLAGMMNIEFQTIPSHTLADPIATHHQFWAEATARARRDDALILLMPPDVAWSDGSFEHVAQLLAAGKKVIFMTYLRAESESFTKVLGGRRVEGQLPLSVSGAQLVQICLQTLHPLMAAYLHDSTHFPIHPEMMLWAVPGEGLLCRILSREMFIYDPASVSLTTANVLESDVDPALIHVIDDSDDLFAVSLATIEKEYPWYRWPHAADADEVADWWLSYDSWVNDILVDAKLRWHYRPVTEQSWRARETVADLFLRRASISREARYLWRTARAQGCSIAARLLACAAGAGVLARAARGRGAAIVFLPANSAFWDVPAESLARVQCVEGAADLARLLRAHHVPNPLPGRPHALDRQLAGADTVELRAADGATLRVERRGGALSVNGVSILGGPIASGKQLVYLVERLLDAAPLHVPTNASDAPSTVQEVTLARAHSRRSRVIDDRGRSPREGVSIHADPPNGSFPSASSLSGERASGELLQPDHYDALERHAEAELAIPLMMAYKPITFERHSYPTRIADLRAIQRYADHNSEAEVPGLFLPGATFAPIGYVNAFTHDERELLDVLRGRIAAALLADCGRAIKPVTNLLVQLGPFRVMSHLAKVFGRAPLTLFEIGPGAAYIGAMMAVAGHRYLAYDVTQSLYLWQHYMLRTVAGAAFAETAGLVSFAPPPAARVVHLPWWQYVQFRGRCPVRADVVYSNSNLGEMSPLALRHALHISADMLKDSPIGAFIYFSTGMLAQSSAEQIAAAFQAAGYVQAMREPFIAYVLEGRDPRPLQQAFAAGIPFFDPSGRGGRLDANTVTALKRSEAPLDAELAGWNYGWRPPFTD
jgi:hypothetical protein